MANYVLLRLHLQVKRRIRLCIQGFGVQGPKGACTQTVYTVAPKYLYRDYFMAYVFAIYMDPQGGVYRVKGSGDLNLTP